MNLAKVLKQKRDAEDRLRNTSPIPVFNGGPADSIEGGGNEIISDGVTLSQLTAGLAAKSNTDHAHEFIDLTDVPSAYTGAGGKIVAVNSGATALEFVAAPAAANGVPAGGTTNQLAAKNSNTDYDLKWVDAPNAANGIPDGGTAEQILSKIDGTDYNAHWVDKPSGSSSPLTTKGDVFVYGSADARLPVGTNGQVLTADSAQTLGVKWAAAGGGIDYYAIFADGVNVSGRTETGVCVLFNAQAQLSCKGGSFYTVWSSGVVFTFKLWDAAKNVLASKDYTGDGSTGRKHILFDTPYTLSPLTNYYISIERASGSIMKYYGAGLLTAFIAAVQSYSGLPNGTLSEAGDCYNEGLILSI